MVEIWDPACLHAVAALSGITDPDDFEEAAFEWLQDNEASIAVEIDD